MTSSAVARLHDLHSGSVVELGDDLHQPFSVGLTATSMLCLTPRDRVQESAIVVELFQLLRDDKGVWLVPSPYLPATLNDAAVTSTTLLSQGSIVSAGDRLLRYSLGAQRRSRSRSTKVVKDVTSGVLRLPSPIRAPPKPARAVTSQEADTPEIDDEYHDVTSPRENTGKASYKTATGLDIELMYFLDSDEGVAHMAAAIVTQHALRYTNLKMSSQEIDMMFRSFQHITSWERHCFEMFIRDYDDGCARISCMSETPENFAYLNDPLIRLLTDLIKLTLDPIEYNILWLLLLATLAQCPGTLSSLVRHKTAAAVMGCMAARPHLTAVQQYGCDVIAEIANHRPQVGDKGPVREGGVQLILQCMSHHASDLRVLRRACRVLATLTDTYITMTTDTLDRDCEGGEESRVSLQHAIELLDFIEEAALPVLRTTLYNFRCDHMVYAECTRCLRFFDEPETERSVVECDGVIHATQSTNFEADFPPIPIHVDVVRRQEVTSSISSSFEGIPVRPIAQTPTGKRKLIVPSHDIVSSNGSNSCSSVVLIDDEGTLSGRKTYVIQHSPLDYITNEVISDVGVHSSVDADDGSATHSSIDSNSSSSVNEGRAIDTKSGKLMRKVVVQEDVSSNRTADQPLSGDCYDPDYNIVLGSISLDDLEADGDCIIQTSGSTTGSATKECDTNLADVQNKPKSKGLLDQVEFFNADDDCSVITNENPSDEKDAGLGDVEFETLEVIKPNNHKARKTRVAAAFGGYFRRFSKTKHPVLSTAYNPPSDVDSTDEQLTKELTRFGKQSGDPVDSFVCIKQDNGTENSSQCPSSVMEDKRESSFEMPAKPSSPYESSNTSPVKVSPVASKPPSPHESSNSSPVKVSPVASKPPSPHESSNNSPVKVSPVASKPPSGIMRSTSFERKGSLRKSVDHYVSIYGQLSSAEAKLKLAKEKNATDSSKPPEKNTKGKKKSTSKSIKQALRKLGGGRLSPVPNKRGKYSAQKLFKEHTEDGVIGIRYTTLRSESPVYSEQNTSPEVSPRNGIDLVKLEEDACQPESLPIIPESTKKPKKPPRKHRRTTIAGGISKDGITQSLPKAGGSLQNLSQNAEQPIVESQVPQLEVPVNPPIAIPRSQTSMASPQMRRASRMKRSSTLPDNVSSKWTNSSMFTVSSFADSYDAMQAVNSYYDKRGYDMDIKKDAFRKEKTRVACVESDSVLEPSPSHSAATRAVFDTYVSADTDSVDDASTEQETPDSVQQSVAWSQQWPSVSSSELFPDNSDNVTSVENKTPLSYIDYEKRIMAATWKNVMTELQIKRHISDTVPIVFQRDLDKDDVDVEESDDECYVSAPSSQHSCSIDSDEPSAGQHSNSSTKVSTLGDLESDSDDNIQPIRNTQTEEVPISISHPSFDVNRKGSSHSKRRLFTKKKNSSSNKTKAIVSIGKHESISNSSESSAHNVHSPVLSTEQTRVSTSQIDVSKEDVGSNLSDLVPSTVEDSKGRVPDATKTDGNDYSVKQRMEKKEPKQKATGNTRIAANFNKTPEISDSMRRRKEWNHDSSAHENLTEMQQELGTVDSGHSEADTSLDATIESVSNSQTDVHTSNETLVATREEDDGQSSNADNDSTAEDELTAEDIDDFEALSISHQDIDLVLKDRLNMLAHLDRTLVGRTELSLHEFANILESGPGVGDYREPEELQFIRDHPELSIDVVEFVLERASITADCALKILQQISELLEPGCHVYHVTAACRLMTSLIEGPMNDSIDGGWGFFTLRKLHIKTETLMRQKREEDDDAGEFQNSVSALHSLLDQLITWKT